MSFPRYPKYKDSGVEWLGEVPAHWEVKKLKHVSPELTVGIVVEPSRLYAEEGVPALRSLNV
jgi:type I restriction enzyme S subunit